MRSSPRICGIRSSPCYERSPDVIGVFAVILVLVLLALVLPGRVEPSLDRRLRELRERDEYGAPAVVTTSDLADTEIDAALAYAAAAHAGLVHQVLYQCDHCGRMYDTPKGCVMHIQLDHESEAPRA